MKRPKPNPEVLDDENPELTDDFFRNMRPAREGLPAEFLDAWRAQRQQYLLTCATALGA